MLKKDLLENYGLQLKVLGTNINCVTKNEMQYIVNWRCEHGHTSFEHPACFKRDNHQYIEKIGAFDIETSNLHANWGAILCWYIKEINAKIIEGECINLADLRTGIGDSRVVRNCVRTLRRYDRLVTQFGTYFDIPFIRNRFLIWKRRLKWPENFPEYGTIYHTDVWRIAKNKLRLHSNRQGVISESLLGFDIKTRIHPEIWEKMLFGAEEEKIKALAYLKDHCLKDVIPLSQNYLILRPFIREGRTSI